MIGTWITNKFKKKNKERAIRILKNMTTKEILELSKNPENMQAGVAEEFLRELSKRFQETSMNNESKLTEKYKAKVLDAINKKFKFSANGEAIPREEAYEEPPKEKNMNIYELIELAKTSEHGACWFSEKGPIYISKEGIMTPAFGKCKHEDI